MDVLLVLLAVIALVVGCLCLSQATLGVGIIAAGCLLGILARIAQAGKHQQSTIKLLKAIWRDVSRIADR